MASNQVNENELLNYLPMFSQEVSQKNMGSFADVL